MKMIIISRNLSKAFMINENIRKTDSLEIQRTNEIKNLGNIT